MGSGLLALLFLLLLLACEGDADLSESTSYNSISGIKISKFTFRPLDREPVAKTRPVIFMHGVLSHPDEIMFPRRYISKKKPGTLIYSIDMYDGLESLINLNRQLTKIIPYMQQIMDSHTDTGVTLLCYSQGGLICRAAVEMMDKHNVHTLITLSSPLAGQYGLTSYLRPYLPFPSQDKEYIYMFFYTRVGQEFVSVANYWNDPYHQDGFTNPSLDVLVAKLNNQTYNPDSLNFKQNFQRLKRLVLVGGPTDSVITPWQSALFGTYNQSMGVINMTQQPWYKNDDFGLRSLDKAGKLTTYIIPGVHHIWWYRNITVYDNCVIPYL